MLCKRCGIFVLDDATFCPICLEPVGEERSLDPAEKLTLELASIKYEIPEDILLTISDSYNGDIDGFVNLMSDNCIIYQDGDIEPFDRPDDMLEALEDQENLFQTHEDVALVILDGKSVKFSFADRVEIYKPEAHNIDPTGWLSEADLNSAKCIVLLNDAKETIAKFDTTEQLAEWIIKTEGKSASMIFIDKEYYEFDIIHCFKLSDMTIELAEALPF